MNPLEGPRLTVSCPLAANPVSLIVVDYTTPFGLAGGAFRMSRTLEALTDIDPFIPLLLLCVSKDELDHQTSLMADMVLTHPVGFPALLDAIENLLSKALRERMQRESGHVALFR